MVLVAQPDHEVDELLEPLDPLADAEVGTGEHPRVEVPTGAHAEQEATSEMPSSAWASRKSR